MTAFAILGCAIFAGIIIIKAHTPSSDEPSDQYSEPFGDIANAPDAFVVNSDGGDWCGWVHADADNTGAQRDHG